MIRVLAVAAGLFGAVGLSQFPEYSQQYMQRLSGAVDELERVVLRFDADAQSIGLSRAEALADLSQGGRMGEARALSMERVLSRYERLSDDLTSLKVSSSLDKLLNFRMLSDEDIARRALADFQAAVPVTPEGFGLGAVGFGIGYSLIVFLRGLLGRLFGRRNRPVSQT